MKRRDDDVTVIEDGNIADAVLLAGISLSLGILTAACMAG